MFRFRSLVDAVQKTLSTSHPVSFTLDIGSCTTRVIIDHRLFFQEPTAIAVHRKSKSVITTGQAAADILGKASPGVDVIFPIRHAKITDVTALQQYIQVVLQQKTPGGQKFVASFLPKTARVSVSPSLSVVQKDFLRRTLHTAGFSQVKLLDKNMALLQHLRAQKYMAPVLCTLDIGGMTTEICVFAQNEVVAHKTLQLGGEDFTQEVIRTLRKTHQCEIGWQTAEKIKSTIGRVTPASQDHPRLLVIRGRDSVTSLPKTVQVSAMDFDGIFLRLTEDICSGIRQLCQDAPAELITAALDQGIFLTGGGSLLHGMGEFLAKKLQCPIQNSPSPFEDVVRGVEV